MATTYDSGVPAVGAAAIASPLVAEDEAVAHGEDKHEVALAVRSGMDEHLRKVAMDDDGVDASTTSGMNSSEKAKHDSPKRRNLNVEEEEDEKTLVLHALEQQQQMQIRSPPASRLAASLMLSRERVTRAARAWRDGARRGFFGMDGEDEEEEESKQEEELDADTMEPTQSESRFHAERALAMRIRQQLAFADPSLCSSSVAVQLLHAPRLVPVRVLPRRLSKAAEIWMFLQRIEYIGIQDVIVRDDDAVYYILDVYHYQEQHRIPTNRAADLSWNLKRTHPHWHDRQPAYRIEQRYSNFSRLRSKIVSAARRKHPPGSFTHRTCSYCSRIVHHLGESAMQPSLKVKLMTTTEMRKSLLSQFITELVFLSRHRHHECCILSSTALSWQYPQRHPLQHSVPWLVKRFLTGQTGENFMR